MLTLHSDDTSVAILETFTKGKKLAKRQGLENESPKREKTQSVLDCDSLGSIRAQLHFYSRITADNRTYQGIHPIVSQDSHHANLAKLVQQALTCLPLSTPDHRSIFDPSGSISVLNGDGNQTLFL